MSISPRIGGGATAREMQVPTRDLENAFWDNFCTLLNDKNYEGLFTLAGAYRQALQHKIEFTAFIQLLLSKKSPDFDQIRKIALMDELFNPDDSHPRIIQALCYFKTNHTAQAYSILQSIESLINDLEEMIEACGKNRMAHLFLELGTFFFKTLKATEKEEEYPCQLKV